MGDSHKIAIIGGSGLYEMEGVEEIARHAVDTPFGPPSGAVVEARCGPSEILFLPRHGPGHALLPGEINYRANIWALKSLGARQVIGVSAVGSLRDAHAPGDFVVPDQYFDFVKHPRIRSFFGQGLVAHISTARPSCPDLAAALLAAGQATGSAVHRGGTYACVDGPRLGTRAESHFLRNAVGADLVGMTNVPEIFLAREAQLCYATLAVVTDYDCWRENPSGDVSVADVLATFGASLARAKALLRHLLAQGVPASDEAHRRSLETAIMTPEAAWTPEHRALLEILRA